MTRYIPVVDIFAGPGGLSEGFSSVYDQMKAGPFKIVLSIEKDYWAHQTLTLRAFLRQFIRLGIAPKDYYAYVNNPSDKNLQKMFSKNRENYEKAKKEAQLLELGKTEPDIIKQKIKSAIKNHKNWILIGGPPCQAYSLAGRSRNAGNHLYIPETDHRHFLYKEYLKILSEHWPSIFVMENVKGLLSSKINNSKIFPMIIKDLKNPSGEKKLLPGKTYSLFSFVTGDSEVENKPEKFIIKSEKYGIPQSRHRVIILGIRNDVLKKTGNPQKLRQQSETPVEKVLNLPILRSQISKRVKTIDCFENWVKLLKKSLTEKWFKQCNTDVQEEIKRTLSDISLVKNLESQQHKKSSKPSTFASWYYDQNLNTTLNHEARSHRDDDLHRYLFAACFAKLHKRSPQLKDFPKDLLPNHRSALKTTIDKANFADRFRVQCIGKPSTTITCHIAKDGHYYIHPDPKQCRSLTVREAARLQTFPDNYFFCGPRTEQFKQVGNAVPPLLAKQLAEIVLDLLNKLDD